MRRTGYPRTYYILLGAVVLLFFGSLATAIHEQVRRSEALDEALRISSWRAAQTQIEFLRFESALGQYMRGAGGVSHEDVALRFEIFWSRLSLALRDSEVAMAEDRPDAAGTAELERMIDGLERIEPTVYALDREDTASYRAILAELDAFRGPLQGLVQSAILHTEEQQSRLAGYVPPLKVSSSLLGILTAGTALVLLLLRDRGRIARLLGLTAEAEQATEAARRQLYDALEISPAGIALFDADRRLLLGNSRYREIFGLSPEQAAPGARLEDILRTRLERRDIRVPDGDGEAWLAAMLHRHDEPRGPLEQQLSDDRWIRTNEQRTQTGGSIVVCSDITELKHRERRLARLAERNQQFATAIATAATGVVIAERGEDGWPISYVNPSFARLLGARAEELIGRPWRLPGDGVDTDCLQASLERGEPFSVETGFRRPDGQEMHLEIRASPVRDSDGRLTAMIGLCNDVTERVRHLEAIERSEARLQSLASHVPGVLYQRRHRPDGRIEYVYVGEQLEEMFGIPPEAVREDPAALAEAVHPDDRHGWERAHQAGRRGHRPRTFEHRFRGRGGETLWIRTVEQAAPEEDGSLLWSGVLLNVTRRKKIEKRLEYLAYHDPLTGLANRVLFEDRLRQATHHVSRSRESMVLHYLDLDSFKEVNDTLGHKAGDQVLTVVSERLREVVRQGDTVARISGDEFAIIQADIADAGDAVKLAERLIETVSQPIRLDERMVTPGCSIGIVTFSGEDANPEELPMRADIALYHAKSAGRGTYRFYDTAMDIQMRVRVGIREELRGAADRGELLLRYQPQVDLDTGEVMGNEAMVRWNSPGRGLRAPADFIPVAEESGLIVEIGRWVLYTACSRNKAWQDAGYPKVPVSVNLSPEQFTRSNVHATVARVLAETGLEPRYLEVEITENVILEDSPRARAALSALREMGVRIALDDFGTGYSSLGYLKAFPVDKIKIDRSFVHEVISNSVDAGIVESVIHLGAKLGVEVTAEGIESIEQLEWLRERGCRIGQGFYLSRSCTVPELEAFWTGTPESRLGGEGVESLASHRRRRGG